MKLGGKIGLVAVGVAVLVGLALVPVLSATTNPATASSAAADPASAPCAVMHITGSPDPASSDGSWSYGGQSFVNFSFSFDHTTITYNSSFGWTVVFTVTQTSPGNWSLEEQRMVGVTILKNVTNPKATILYCYHAQENDAAFANITNDSTVYVKDEPVRALGIVNASAAVNGSVDQTLSITNTSGTEHASLSVMANATASVTFSPSLGLIPLDLTGVYAWNSSSTASYTSGWGFAYAFTELNGTSGSHTKMGSASGTATVNVTGHQFAPCHPFSDRKSRIGVVLFIQGPFNSYDGFILVPRSFDLFGGVAHPYASWGFGSAGISSEVLYVSPGPGSLAITAADQRFGSADYVGFGPGPTAPGPVSDAMSTPSTTVYGQPMSVAEAHSIDQGLTTGGFGGGSAGSARASAGAMTSGMLIASVAVGAGIVVGGVVVVLGWRAYARRP